MTQSGFIAAVAVLLMLTVGIRLALSPGLRRNPASLGLLACALAWTLAKALALELPAGAARFTAVSAEFAVLAWLPPFLLGTALGFGTHTPAVRRLAMACLALPSALATGLAVDSATNGWIVILTASPDGEVTPTGGPLYPFFVAYLAAATAAAVAIMAVRRNARLPLEPRRTRTITVAFLIPAALSVADSLGLRFADGTSLVPVSMLAASIILVWGIAGSRLLRPIAVAQETVVESLDEPVIIASALGRLLYANPAAKRLSRGGGELAAAFPGLSDYIVTDDDAGPVSVATAGAHPIRLDGTDWAVHLTMLPEGNPDGPTMIFALHNVSAMAAQAQQLEALVHERTGRLEQTVREKELLLSELNHRVKNNLQIILSLVNLQARRTTRTTNVREAQLAMKERIRAISLVHERMYRGSDDFDGHIDFNAYLVELVNGIAGMMGTAETPKPVFHLGDGAFCVAGEVCVDLGLVINELVTNAYKHAVLAGQGPLEISLAEGSDGLRLTIRDHGPGLPQPDTPDQGHLGMTIVRTILAKYGARLLAGADGGAWVGFDLPLDTTGLVTSKEDCSDC